MRYFLFTALFLCIFVPARAQVVGESTGLPLPRFVSLRGDQVYARTGPGTRYPIKWIYQRQFLPVEITQEFDNWRKIRDIDGEEGWVHHSLLSGKRFVIVNSDENVTVYRSPSPQSRIIAQFETNVVAGLNECKADWCHVSKKGFDGWIRLTSLWGVYEGERIE